MQSSRKLNMALFGVAVIDLTVILECLRIHVPATSIVSTFIALVEILFLALASFEPPVIASPAVAFAVPDDEHEEIAKRINHFGLDGEHPSLTRADWMRAIALDQTQDSYWEWVTQNEILAEKLLNLPGMHGGRRNDTVAKSSDRFKGLRLLRPHSQNE